MFCMDTLLTYLNGLEKQARAVFCADCGTSENYLRKAISSRQILRPEVCSQIELHSGRQVTREMLRPTDWHRIWPEIVGRATQPAAGLDTQPERVAA